VSALEMADSDTQAAQSYADRMRGIIDLLASRFEDNAVNLLCAHTHLEGAAFSGSERTVHIGDEWAATPQALPHHAHYIALGHIHKPQKVAAPSPARYAGSPLQMDFGEAGEEKSFVLVEAQAGRPAHIETIGYRAGRRLSHVEATLDELEARVDELKAAGWLRVLVPLESPDPDINRKVRTLLLNAVVVDVRLPEGDVEEVPSISVADHTPNELFRDYYRRRHGQEAEAGLLALFDELLRTAERRG
jgi:exonuclease SbcD